MLDANRVRYCGTLDDVMGFDLAPPIEAAMAEGPEVRTPPQREERPRVALPEEPSDAVEPRVSALRPAPEPRELGKGGSQHRYVQHLVKGLAEERGFRAVIEEAVEGGQVDVALYRDDLSIACEISVTSTAQYEAQNLAKCAQAGFSRVLAIAADAKRLKAIETAARARLSDEEMGCIDFLTPEHVAAALDAFAAPSEEASVVRGYRVKVSRTIVGADEAKDRRSAIARVIAQSMRGLPQDK
ncbi:hypothetical protein [Brevundimonas sp. A19_0]|uniref:hypothetical protein n=1 Tax=Brevundimonas sp. A19_0 TaxID=2821087 RepID=UPI001AD952AA|nr:hypothetical protein [Brevundimonas sp. A19_0]MBO9501199.1 hypothetical protein [Brevundimonas sp. A19_0]